MSFGLLLQWVSQSIRAVVPFVGKPPTWRKYPDIVTSPELEAARAELRKLEFHLAVTKDSIAAMKKRIEDEEDRVRAEEEQSDGEDTDSE